MFDIFCHKIFFQFDNITIEDFLDINMKTCLKRHFESKIVSYQEKMNKCKSYEVKKILYYEGLIRQCKVMLKDAEHPVND